MKSRSTKLYTFGMERATAVQNQCPSCGRVNCTRGHIAPDSFDDLPPSKFYPAGAQDWAFRPGVGLQNRQTLQCCLTCGLVWSYADPAALSKLIAKHVGVVGHKPVETFVTDRTKPACPSCHKGLGVPGGMVVGFDRHQLSTFHPEGAKYWTNTAGAKLQDGNIMHCCNSCGLTWAHVQVSDVHTILEKLGVPRGEVPVRASYTMHVLRWVGFLLVSGAVAGWISTFSR